jgi:predicted AAA+ superfamily ATPase
MEIVPRFFKDPSGSFFLFGPRGTGKSTWTRQRFPEALVLDLLDPAVFRTYSARPERLVELIDGNPQKTQVVIDEIQRVPSLLTVVHKLIEERRGLQFTMTGSSARKIKRAGVDLLAGRALLRTLHPFMAAELGAQFKLEDALQYGLIPLVVMSQDPAGVLRSYAALYVQEEVKMEGLVKDIGGFSRFLEAVSFSHAAVLTISNLARECEVKRRTVEGYISILEDLLLAFTVPVFTRRAKRAVAAHPKFYLSDAGLFRALRPRGPLDSGPEAEGAALEGLVAEHIRAWNAYRGSRNQLFYWRTRSGVEVDLVLYGEDGLWAIEVKNSQRVHRADLRHLKSFVSDYPECRPLMLYRGADRLGIDGIPCVPCETFLKSLHPDRLLDETVG